MPKCNRDVGPAAVDGAARCPAREDVLHAACEYRRAQQRGAAESNLGATTCDAGTARKPTRKDNIRAAAVRCACENDQTATCINGRRECSSEILRKSPTQNRSGNFRSASHDVQDAAG